MSTGKINRKATGKMVSLFPQQLEVINHLIADKGMGSASDVIRQALNFFHNALYPAYVFHETPAGKLKALKLKEIEAEIELTPEQLAKDIKARIVTNANGDKFVRLRGIANIDRLIKLSEFKEIIKIETWLANEHKNFIANGGEIPDGIEGANIFP